MSTTPPADPAAPPPRGRADFTPPIGMGFLPGSAELLVWILALVVAMLVTWIADTLGGLRRLSGLLRVPRLMRLVCGLCWGPVAVVLGQGRGGTSDTGEGGRNHRAVLSHDELPGMRMETDFPRRSLNGTLRSRAVRAVGDGPWLEATLE